MLQKASDSAAAYVHSSAGEGSSHSTTAGDGEAELYRQTKFINDVWNMLLL